MTDEAVETIEIPTGPDVPGQSFQEAPVESVLLLPLEDIRPDPLNVRQIKPSQADENQLFASVAEIGVRFPIIVRPDHSGMATRFVIVAGERRWRAASAARHALIPAIVRELDEAHTLVDQIVENAVRKDMHPVNNWKSMSWLMDQGYSVDSAAAIMGLSERQGARLLKLGSLHPDILAKLSESAQIPQWDVISVIASAPLDVQGEALKRHAQGEWFGVAEACRQRRISITLAIFDTESSGVTFEEDLFASADDPERFTTTDVSGFIAAQKKALAARAADAKGHMIIIEPKSGAPDARLPVGWVTEFGDIPKRWKKTDNRKVFAYVVPAGYHVGKVVEVLARPIEDRPAKADEAKDQNADDAADNEGEDSSVSAGDDAPDDAPSGRDPIRKAGHHILSKAKRAAIAGALDRVLEGDRSLNVAHFVVPLLLAISGENVSIEGDPDASWRKVSFNDLTPQIVGEDGRVCWEALDDAELCRLMAEYIKRMVVFSSPMNSITSGPAAEWIGTALDAEQDMPRVDTAEMLNACNHTLLKTIAAGAKITGNSAKELKERLVGNAPRWNPVMFGAAGPHQPAKAVSDQEGDEESGGTSSPF